MIRKEQIIRIHRSSSKDTARTASGLRYTYLTHIYISYYSSCMCRIALLSGICDLHEPVQLLVRHQHALEQTLHGETQITGNHRIIASNVFLSVLIPFALAAMLNTKTAILSGISLNALILWRLRYRTGLVPLQDYIRPKFRALALNSLVLTSTTSCSSFTSLMLVGSSATHASQVLLSHCSSMRPSQSTEWIADKSLLRDKALPETENSMPSCRHTTRILSVKFYMGRMT
jgi:hypothetical protein